MYRAGSSNPKVENGGTSIIKRRVVMVPTPRSFGSRSLDGSASARSIGARGRGGTGKAIVPVLTVGRSNRGYYHLYGMVVEPESTPLFAN